YSRTLFAKHTATSVIYTLSLHDALPIFLHHAPGGSVNVETVDVRLDRCVLDGLDPLVQLLAGLVQPLGRALLGLVRQLRRRGAGDRKSTRLNSSHVKISYAVFCLKKKKK